MLFLFTGQPGTGKTLNLLKETLKRAKDDSRRVLYFNLKGLDIAQCQERTHTEWVELKEEDIRKAVHEFTEPGDMLIIDEIQDFYPVRQGKEELSPFVKSLATHRHNGIDIYIATQHPKLIDVAIRRQVGTHYHLKRPANLKYSKITQWDKCADVDNDKSYGNSQVIETKRVSFDKEIYSLYKSSELHTHKTKIPTRVYTIFFILIPLALLIIGYIVYRFYTSITQEHDLSTSQPKKPAPAQQNSPPAPRDPNSTRSYRHNPFPPGIYGVTEPWPEEINQRSYLQYRLSDHPFKEQVSYSQNPFDQYIPVRFAGYTKIGPKESIIFEVLDRQGNIQPKKMHELKAAGFFVVYHERNVYVNGIKLPRHAPPTMSGNPNQDPNRRHYGNTATPYQPREPSYANGHTPTNPRVNL